VHVAMIVDSERLEAEQSMLNRLAVGLIGEGIRLTRIVPEGSASQTDWERAIALAARVEYAPSVVPWMRRHRAERIMERFDRHPPDVVLAIGRATWALAQDIARAADCAVVFDVWSTDVLRATRRLRAMPTGVYFAAATEPLAAALRRRAGASTVLVVPFGVSPPPEPHPIFSQSEEFIGVAVIGRGRSLRAYRAFVPALATVMKEQPAVRAFVELSPPHDHPIWHLFDSHGLLDRVSTFVNAVAHRSLLTRCDLAAAPDPCGEARSIALDLMGCGVPIAAAADPWLDWQTPTSTALVNEPESTPSWETTLRRLLTDRAATSALAAAGRMAVERGYRSSRQVDSITKLLETAANPPSIPISKGLTGEPSTGLPNRR
jgi:glycosyltransferase involved in cell wall biosynthesis